MKLKPYYRNNGSRCSSSLARTTDAGPSVLYKTYLLKHSFLFNFHVHSNTNFPSTTLATPSEVPLIFIFDSLFPKFMLRQMEILVRAGRQAGSTGAGNNQSRKPVQSAGLTLSDAYQLLGIDKTADKTAAKRAYRKLMSQHHPDKLVAKGLPPEMIKIATEKTQAIKAAYDLIKDRRGW